MYQQASSYNLLFLLSLNLDLDMAHKQPYRYLLLQKPRIYYQQYTYLLLFLGKNDGVYRLSFFGGLQLATQILMVISIAVHVISNAKPMLLSFGTKSYKELGIDLAMILSGILLFTGVCFVIYYFRWKMI